MADFDPSFDDALGDLAAAAPIRSTRCPRRVFRFDVFTVPRRRRQHQRSDRVGIVGRPVFTVLADDFSGQQDGTLHFQHLKNVNAAAPCRVGTLDEHCFQWEKRSLPVATRLLAARSSRLSSAVWTRRPAADRFADV